MVREFEVVKVFSHHNRGQFIFAKHLGNNHDFEVPNGSVFGNIPIYHYVEIKSILDENGNPPRAEIFVFRPTSLKWFPEGHFKEGQKVNLTIFD
jgi:hypothetical protein